MTEPLSSEIQIIAQASDHTQSALLITVVQTAKAIGFFDTLLNGLDVKMKQVVYTLVSAN